MKKISVLVAVLAFAGVAGASLDWYYSALTLGPSYQTGWLVSMYKDVNNDTDIGSLIFYNNGTLSSSDDSVAFSTSVADDGGDRYWELLGIVTPGNFTAYSVIFNASTFASASQYIIVDATKKSIGDASGINLVTYSLGSNSGAWKNIQAIPEPATALLFGIGGMGAWMVRRSKLKSKEEADA
jgi:hypothetical protein